MDGTSSRGRLYDNWMGVQSKLHNSRVSVTRPRIALMVISGPVAMKKVALLPSLVKNGRWNSKLMLNLVVIETLSLVTMPDRVMGVLSAGA